MSAEQTKEQNKEIVRRAIAAFEDRFEMNLANREVDLVHRAPPFAAAEW